MPQLAVVGWCCRSWELDLVPISEKRCWADEASSKDSQIGVGDLTGTLELEVEDGEVLISPSPLRPTSNGRDVMSPGVDCREAALEGVGDDLALKDLVDSLSKVDYEIPRLPNGSLDLSNGFDLGIFAEAPHCLIGFPLGRPPALLPFEASAATQGVLGSPLILRRMPPFFDFSTANMSVVPVWVKFGRIPIQDDDNGGAIEIDVTKDLVTERDYCYWREIAPVDKQVWRKVARKVSPVKSSTVVALGGLQPDRQVDLEACPSSMVAARGVVPIQIRCLASSPAKRNQIRDQNSFEILGSIVEGESQEELYQKCYPECAGDGSHVPGTGSRMHLKELDSLKASVESKSTGETAAMLKHASAKRKEMTRNVLRCPVSANTVKGSEQGKERHNKVVMSMSSVEVPNARRLNVNKGRRRGKGKNPARISLSVMHTSARDDPLARLKLVARRGGDHYIVYGLYSVRKDVFYGRTLANLGAYPNSLDRVLVKSHWGVEFPDAVTVFLPPGFIYDHSASVVDVKMHTTRPNRPFKFLNHWTTADSFMSIVHNIWNCSIRRSAMHQLIKKQGALKAELRSLNKC
ncbi:hypothetical protein Dimus_037664 [Dionaea muscipula]